MSRGRRVIALAMRARTWALESQAQALQEAAAQQRDAERAAESARILLAGAHAAQTRLLAQPVFQAGALGQQGAYAAWSRRVVDEADQALRRAAELADEQREQVQSTLQQRDTLRRAHDRQRRAAATDHERGAARERDRDWLARVRKPEEGETA